MSDKPNPLTIEKEAKLGIEQYLKKAVLPILYDLNEAGIDQIATGTLFSVDGRLFLITARHVFDDYDASQLAYPISPSGPTPYTFGRVHLMLPKDPEIDVALIEILEKETIDRLRAGWTILTPQNIEAATMEGQFLVSGYPSVKNIRRGDLLGGSLVTVYTERMRTIPKNLNRPATAVDLYFHYDEDALSLDGKPVKTLDMPGMSGASVWKYTPERQPIWTPESSLRVIGVQSSYAYPKREFFRAINWLAVAEMLKKVDTRLGDIVAEAYTARARLVTKAKPTKKTAKKTARTTRRTKPQKSTKAKVKAKPTRERHSRKKK